MDQWREKSTGNNKAVRIWYSIKVKSTLIMKYIERTSLLMINIWSWLGEINTSKQRNRSLFEKEIEWEDRIMSLYRKKIFISVKFERYWFNLHRDYLRKILTVTIPTFSFNWDFECSTCTNMSLEISERRINQSMNVSIWHRWRSNINWKTLLLFTSCII